MSSEEKREQAIKIHDKSKIIIRALKDSDIEAANTVGQKAFGSSKKYATVNRYANELYVAEYEKSIVGLAVALHYGSISLVIFLGFYPVHKQTASHYTNPSITFAHSAQESMAPLPYYQNTKGMESGIYW